MKEDKTRLKVILVQKDNRKKQYLYPLPPILCLFGNPEVSTCAFTYQSMILDMNKQACLKPWSVYLKTCCDKKKSVREVVNQLLERVV